MENVLHGKRVWVAVSNDLVTDQRVHRACTTLSESGCHVHLVGRLLPQSMPVVRSYKCSRMRLIFKKTAFFYAEFNVRLFFKLLFSKSDAFYANDTDTLLACYMASCIRNKPLFFDAHELFSEVPELVGRHRVQSVWCAIERWILPKVAASVTVSRGVSDEYYRRYGIRMSVVRNLPLSSFGTTIHPATDDSELKTVLYQGAVNEGRGVRWMIDALEYLPDCRFVVAGVGDLYHELAAYALSKKWHDRIVFLGRIEPDRLRQITLKAHLGLILLENKGLNYYHSFPNRVGDYVHACVPVLATAFPELRQVVEQYDLGVLIREPQQDECYPKTVAEAVRTALDCYHWDDPESRLSHFAKARRDLCWDTEKHILIEAFASMWKF